MDTSITYACREVKFSDLDPNDFIGGLLLNGDWYELKNLEFIRSLGVSGPYIDVGSCIGTHALYFSLFCKATEVHAFEPNPISYQRLLKNLEINNVTCKTYPLALSDRTGTTGFEFSLDNVGMAIMSEGADAEMVPLDSLGISDAVVMKIDVEGTELDVLRGAEQTLRTVKHLFVEIWAPITPAREENDRAVKAYLVDQGFKWQSLYMTDRLNYFTKV